MKNNTNRQQSVTPQLNPYAVVAYMLLLYGIATRLLITSTLLGLLPASLLRLSAWAYTYTNPYLTAIISTFLGFFALNQIGRRSCSTSLATTISLATISFLI